MAPRTKPRTTRGRRRVSEQAQNVPSGNSSHCVATQTHPGQRSSTHATLPSDIQPNLNSNGQTETDVAAQSSATQNGENHESSPVIETVVSFNDLGQPDDEDNNSTFGHFLGTIARNRSYCPLNYKDWRLMPKSYKDDMIRAVKKKFELPPGEESYILTSINKKWRNWKCLVKSENFDPTMEFDPNMSIEIGPDRVHPDQYKALLENWHSKEAKEQSEKNKKARAQLDLFHRMGKKRKRDGRYPTRAELFAECFATKADGSLISTEILEEIEQMKELEAEDLENVDIHDPDDAFANIKGADKHGHVRMYGLGVTRADVHGSMPSRASSHRTAMEYKEKYQEEKKKYDLVLEKLEALSALVHEEIGHGQLDSSDSPTHNTRNSSQSTRSETPANQRSASGPILSSNNQRSLSSTAPTRRIRVGSYVILKSLGDINVSVATGIVREMGPLTVNGEELGCQWCEIIIQFPLKNDESLIKPFGLIQEIGDSRGVPVAWPLSLVELDENESFI